MHHPRTTFERTSTVKSNSPIHRMSRIRRQLIGAAALATAATIALSGCSGGGNTTIDKSAPTKLSGTVSLWHFFTDREAKVIQGVVTDFEKLHPGVKVVVHSGQDDTKLQQAISAGNNVDVGLSYSTDIVGAFCNSGAFRDLTPYIKRDKVDVSGLTAITKSYTEFKGKRCAMPALSDVDALYYNTDMLTAAGIASPPKTLTELEDDALKLTTYT